MPNQKSDEVHKEGEALQLFYLQPGELYLPERTVKAIVIQIKNDGSYEYDKNYLGGYLSRQVPLIFVGTGESLEWTPESIKGIDVSEVGENTSEWLVFRQYPVLGTSQPDIDSMEWSYYILKREQLADIAHRDKSTIDYPGSPFRP